MFKKYRGVVLLQMKCEIRSYSNPLELVFIPEFKISSLKTAYIMINLVFVFDTFL